MEELSVLRAKLSLVKKSINKIIVGRIGLSKQRRKPSTRLEVTKTKALSKTARLWQLANT